MTQDSSSKEVAFFTGTVPPVDLKIGNNSRNHKQAQSRTALLSRRMLWLVSAALRSSGFAAVLAVGTLCVPLAAQAATIFLNGNGTTQGITFLGLADLSVQIAIAPNTGDAVLTGLGPAQPGQ